MTRRALSLATMLALLSFVASQSLAVEPHPLFSDGAVLQQGMKAPVWGTADDGEEVTVEFQGQTAKTTAADGKWRVTLQPLKAGGPHVLTISGKNKVEVKDVLVGEVWICSGQSNMAWTVSNSTDAEKEIAAANYPTIRLLTVPRRGAEQPQETASISWTACTPQSVPSFSAVGYFFGRDLQQAINVPIGLINTSYGGTPAEAWTSRGKLESIPALRDSLDLKTDASTADARAKQQNEKALKNWEAAVAKAKEAGKPAPPRPRLVSGASDRLPSRLYNGMVAPLAPYAIRGAIWYQGESNASRAYQYRTLFPAMIADWREQWGQGDFTFLFVQLAPFKKIVKEPVESDWAELREAQAMTLRTLPNTGMAVITDAGEEDDIHPKRKQPVGARLALAARALAYGEKIEHSGPVFEELTVKGNKAVLRFSHVGGGLVARGGPLTGFTICGEDRQWANGYAEIDGDTVVVHSPEVAKPVAVRFGWNDYPVVNLWNAAGLPASPFRTDDFPGITMPKTAGGN